MHMTDESSRLARPGSLKVIEEIKGAQLAGQT